MQGYTKRVKEETNDVDQANAHVHHCHQRANSIRDALAWPTTGPKLVRPDNPILQAAAPVRTFDFTQVATV